MIQVVLNPKKSIVAPLIMKENKSIFKDFKIKIMPCIQ